MKSIYCPPLKEGEQQNSLPLEHYNMRGGWFSKQQRRGIKILPKGGE
ncbi:MAG: hypothetical protein AB1743_09975 [Actinomycetota bacterium]